MSTTWPLGPMTPPQDLTRRISLDDKTLVRCAAASRFSRISSGCRTRRTARRLSWARLRCASASGSMCTCAACTCRTGTDPSMPAAGGAERRGWLTPPARELAATSPGRPRAADVAQPSAAQRSARGMHAFRRAGPRAPHAGAHHGRLSALTLPQGVLSDLLVCLAALARAQLLSVHLQQLRRLRLARQHAAPQVRVLRVLQVEAQLPELGLIVLGRSAAVLLEHRSLHRSSNARRVALHALARCDARGRVSAGNEQPRQRCEQSKRGPTLASGAHAGAPASSRAVVSSSRSLSRAGSFVGGGGARVSRLTGAAAARGGSLAGSPLARLAAGSAAAASSAGVAAFTLATQASITCRALSASDVAAAPAASPAFASLRTRLPRPVAASSSASTSAPSSASSAARPSCAADAGAEASAQCSAAASARSSCATSASAPAGAAICAERGAGCAAAPRGPNGVVRREEGRTGMRRIASRQSIVLLKSGAIRALWAAAAGRCSPARGLRPATAAPAAKRLPCCVAPAAAGSRAP